MTKKNILWKVIVLLKSLFQTIKTFDADFYLKSYSDIPRNKPYAYFHFLRHGQAKGRLGKPPQLQVGSSLFCDHKDTVLLVSHDANRTGAPILALNICEELNKQFNVIVFLLRDGILSSFFESNCYKIMTIGDRSITDPMAIKIMVKKITQQYKIKFCIVNSIDSYPVLAPLADSFIPSLLLVHEFLAYTRPVDKFSTALFWAGSAIFSAKIVQKNASNINTINAIKGSHVLSQGRSSIPQAESQPPFSLPQFSTKTMTKSSKPFVVLGAGTVHYRKGVDLFIATAAEIERLYPDYNIKMVWVGGNFKPEQDTNYSCFLTDQIERSGLINCFEFIDEVSDLDSLYGMTDLFFLSSRLDPLPNVAIDVMSLGIPLVCFEDGTGMIEILMQDADTATCIVPYLSVNHATEKIIEFYKSPEYYSLIASKVKELAQKNFDMKDYVSQLVQLSAIQSKISEQEAMDCLTLNNSNDFIEHFSAPYTHRSDAILRHVRSWHSQVSSYRKPAPGFNREVYDLHHQCRARGIEPFADYIRRGKPKGSWQDEVITPAMVANHIGNQPRCAVHIHAFYPDLLSDILARLRFNSSIYDIFISTTEVSAESILAVLSEHKINNYELRVVPNKGRDIGPFLTEFGEALQQYDVVGHIHTKKSLDVKKSEVIKTWINFLLENLLGGKNCMMDLIITKFKHEPELGLVFADDPHLLGWDKNKGHADELAIQLGLGQLSEGRFSFPVGTMFWARPNALKPLFDMNWTWDMYPEEPLPYDGSVLHAIERLIPVVVAKQGFTQAVTYIPGITR